MPDYTLRNLKELENASERFGIDGLEARFARRPLELASLGLSYQRLTAGFRQPFGHSHDVQEEVYVVLAGGGRIKLDDEIVPLRQWDAIRVAGRVTRQLEAGPEGLEILAIGAPQADDTRMLPGWWAD